MALRRARRRRQASITSLIDVIFLLLLFFMLASSFSKYSEIELSVVSATGAASEDHPEILQLHIDRDLLTLDGVALSQSDMLAQLRGRALPADAVLVVSLSDDVTTQRMVDVLMELNTVPDLRFRLLEPT